MIQFGIAGIPLSCKGRTVIDGIKDTSNLGKRETGKGLEIMEVEILRPGEELGTLEEIKKTAKKRKIKLWVHAPYYTNLGLGKGEAERSLELIGQAAEFAKAVDAELLILHLGAYGKNRKETLKRIIENVRNVRNLLRGKKPKVALETSGKQLLFGTLDEIIEVCRKVSGVVPLINFAHIHARGNGCLKEKKDFEAIFEKLKQLKLRRYYTHFSGVAYEASEELNFTPMKKGDLKFEPLAEYLLEKNYNINIISASPLLEHDAINMKIILERVREKLKKKPPKKVRPPRVKVKKPPEKKPVKPKAVKVKPKKVEPRAAKPTEYERRKEEYKKRLLKRVAEYEKRKKAQKRI